MATIVIDNDLNTFVDGVNFGQPADAIANNVALAPGVNVAMKALIDNLRGASSAALAAKEAEKAVVVAEKEAVTAERDDARTVLAEVKTLANSVEDEELKASLEAKANDGLRSAIEKKKVELEAKKAAIEAELGKLEAGDGAVVVGATPKN